MKVYLIVLKSYDYYEFNVVHGVFKTRKECIKVANDYDPEYKVVSSEYENELLQEREETHFYIEEYSL